MARCARWVVGLTALSLVGLATPAYAVSESAVARSWGTNGTVYSVTRIGDLLVIGGRFSSVVSPSGQARRAGSIAALRASTGAWVWSGNAGGTVYALESDGASVWAGGRFGVKRFSPAGRQLAFRTPVSVGTVRSLAVSNGRVYYGGHGVAAATTSGKGLWKRGITAKAAGGVRAVALAGNRLLVGGYFCTINGAARPGMAALTLNGSVDRGFRATSLTCGKGTSGKTPYDFAVSGSRVYVAAAGHFNGLLAIDARNGRQIWSRRANGDYQTVTLQGGALYVGGHFTSVCQHGTCSIPRMHVAKYSTSGSVDTHWNPSVGPSRAPYFYGVWALDSDSSAVYAGGIFAHVNNARHRSVAIFR